MTTTSFHTDDSQIIRHSPFLGDELALPKPYLIDQPGLKNHADDFWIRVTMLQEGMVNKIPLFLNGSTKIDDIILKTFKEDWINALKRLTHSKSELNEKHMYRPIQV